MRIMKKQFDILSYGYYIYYKDLVIKEYIK